MQIFFHVFDSIVNSVVVDLLQFNGAKSVKFVWLCFLL